VSADGDFDLTAAALRADSGDVSAALDVLARKLEAALPGRTNVERRAKRVFSSDKRVRSILVEFGADSFGLRVEGARLEAWREQRVGGIAIKRETLGPADWVASLTTALRREAEHSEEAREALARLLG